jgi:heptosyltransferase-1
MGDILHAMPAVLRLRTIFPKAKLGWVVEKRWSALLENNIEMNGLVMPLVDEIHLVDTRAWRTHLMSGAMGEVRSALRSIRRQKYEIALDFQGSIKSAIISRLSGAPQRYGFAEPWETPASFFYNNKVRSTAPHVVEQNLELASAITKSPGGIPAGVKLSFVSGMEKEFADELKSSPYVILNPGAGWGAKQWPVERYAEVALALGKEGFRSLINFGPGEEELARALEQSSQGHAFARQFGLRQLKAATWRAALFIGGDTGPLHLAAALNVPVVALFGPTDPARTGPYGTRSIVLRDPASITSHKRNRETEAGLKNISAEQVIAAARELLDAGTRA